METSPNFKDFGDPMEPIKMNEISGIWAYLQAIDWTDPWFCGLGIFHVTCAILTILTRNKGVLQAVYFSVLMVLVLCAEYINQWAAQNWKLFSKQQYFDSKGLFISVVFSVPLLVNCMVMVVSWLWDVGLLISNVKDMKIKQLKRAATKRKEKEGNSGKKKDTNGKQEKEGDSGKKADRNGTCDESKKDK
ncbi:transmembrane protein 18-like [Mya arenaria]|uniref:transmembrane protein 18-like n=1 Tax=Mya arenaria TaxID=6604 RepID=UPI0022E70693|nr:transmembrane protein 18-like [Mya arenaria]